MHGYSHIENTSLWYHAYALPDFGVDVAQCDRLHQDSIVAGFPGPTERKNKRAQSDTKDKYRTWTVHRDMIQDSWIKMNSSSCPSRPSSAVCLHSSCEKPFPLTERVYHISGTPGWDGMEGSKALCKFLGTLALCANSRCWTCSQRDYCMINLVPRCTNGLLLT